MHFLNPLRIEASGNPQYTGPFDHNFVVGQYIQGEAFSESNYNLFQKITQVVDSKTIITDAQFTVDDPGNLFERNSAAETFILGPYGKYFSEYRDDLRGDLTGDFDFFNSFLGDNGSIYFQRGASYRIKSNEATVQLIELDENLSTTSETIQFEGIKPKVGLTGDNTQTTQPNTNTESATKNIDNQGQTTTQNMNVQTKSSQIIKINGVKHNPDNFRNYPSA